MKIVYRISHIVYSFFLICLFAAAVEAAQSASLKELLENSRDYDGEKVIYKGEVIGDIMTRGDYAWINVRDETGAIGIFCSQELTSEIEYQGSYKFFGDTVSVRGTFHRSCPEHGGDTDIHAEKITVVQKGEAIAHPLEKEKLIFSIVLLAVALTLGIIYLIARRFR